MVKLMRKAAVLAGLFGLGLAAETARLRRNARKAAADDAGN
jgi:hypothetical protein